MLYGVFTPIIALIVALLYVSLEGYTIPVENVTWCKYDLQHRITSTNKQNMSKKLIQKLQQLIDKLPKGKERKSIREIVLELKLRNK